MLKSGVMAMIRTATRQSANAIEEKVTAVLTGPLSLSGVPQVISVVFRETGSVNGTHGKVK
jgi:hypothetical protein